MFDNLAAIFCNNVVAAYDEYVEQRISQSAGRDRHIRTAVAAATALYHFREHLPDNMDELGESLAQASSDYALMRGVAIASKHKVANRGRPLVARADDIREVTVIIRYSDGQGEYFHTQSKIDVVCTDGTVRWLDPSLTRILNFWGTNLAEAGVCPYNVRLEPEEPGSRYLSRDEASTKLDLEVMRGLGLRQSMQLLRFDSTLGHAVPIDLSGAILQANIYAPPSHTLDITISHPDLRAVTTSIPLTHAENFELHHISGEAERAAFMQRLMYAHRSTVEEQLRKDGRAAIRNPQDQ